MRMNSLKPILTGLFLFFLVSVGMAQDFMLQGWFWDYPRFSGNARWSERLDAQAEMIDSSGFTYLWVPPLSRPDNEQMGIGYDVKDYYDLGETLGGGPTRFGKLENVEDVIAKFNSLGIKTVADMVYNHRSGGDWEANPSIEGWIENFNATKVNAGDNPYPSDRYRLILPLGGTSGNGEGSYFFKISSASGSANFHGRDYRVLMWTQTKFINSSLDEWQEQEPNAGGDCGEAYDTLQLGRATLANIDGLGCGVDEFKLEIAAGDFDPAGDTLYITLTNYNAGSPDGFSDHYIYGIYYAGTQTDIQDQLVYQTQTDFTNMPSGRGGMTWQNFRPNGEPTNLSSEEDKMYWFYDLDQNVVNTQDVMNEWTDWMFDEHNIGGLRIDAVKHFPAAFVGNLLDHIHDEGHTPGMVVGESFDYNTGVLNGWVNGVKANMDQDTRDDIDVRIFDFSLRLNLEQAHDAFGYDVRNLFQSSIVDVEGASANDVVTFVNNHDFRDPGTLVDNDPQLGYAYILTNTQLGVPCVFYPDYFGPNNYRGEINALIEASKRYLTEANTRDYLSRIGTPYAANYISGFDNTSLIYQMGGGTSGREVVMAINFAGDTLKVDHAINTGNFNAGDTLTDIFGVSSNDYAVVNGSNQIYMEVPPRSFAMWVQGDLVAEQIPIENYANDTFFIDRNIGVAVHTRERQQEGIMVYPNPFRNRFTLHTSLYDPQVITVELLDSKGTPKYSDELMVTFGEEDFTIDLSRMVMPRGFYTLRVTTNNQVFTEKVVKL